MALGTLRIRFLSRNEHKIREVTSILSPADVVASNVAIDELQTADTEKLVRDKCLKAFKKIGHPVFVEHTGLYVSSLNDFPGGLTQVFWDTLGPERFCAIFGAQSDNRVIAKTVIGYCDSKKIHQFEGSVHGTIPQVAKGPSGLPVGLRFCTKWKYRNLR